MKVREQKEVSGGMGGTHLEYRVIELPKTQKEPAAGQEPVPDDTPLHDWRS